jgi:hypothetical protein
VRVFLPLQQGNDAGPQARRKRLIASKIQQVRKTFTVFISKVFQSASGLIWQAAALHIGPIDRSNLPRPA